MYYFLLHYPTRDTQISYKLAFSYPNNFSYLNIFKNQEVQSWLDNQGSTVPQKFFHEYYNKYYISFVWWHCLSVLIVKVMCCNVRRFYHRKRQWFWLILKWIALRKSVNWSHSVSHLSFYHLCMYLPLHYSDSFEPERLINKFFVGREAKDFVK